MSGWYSYVQAAASGVGAVFAWVALDLWRVVTSVPQGYLWDSWVSKAGAAAELLDGTLKLRYCTTVFTHRFAPWVLPRKLVEGFVNGMQLLQTASWIVGVTMGKGLANWEDTPQYSSS